MAPQQENTTRAAQIIDDIRTDIERGLGIVPVLGSGISAPSGIPAGEDYHAYLFFCLERLFARQNGDSNTSEHPWDPSSLRWPPYTTVRTYPNLEKRMLEWTKEQDAKLQSATAPKQFQRALWQSLGAVADWRAMLHLLSRTRLDADGNVTVKEPDPRIIDSFFINITEGKQPNTAHTLLAHLADVLRVKVILTTNFDTLLEAAFRRLEMPVATFDVHYEAGFPDGRFARAQRSIVKINGGRYGLRADFTLDRLPDATDFENFVSYLTPLVFPLSMSQPSNNEPVQPSNQRNLLVMGVSGRERRTIALICHAMLSLPKLKTYWVCHQKAEIGGILDTFREVSGTLHKRSQSKPQSEIDDVLGRLRVAATTDLGLFLLHVYQRIFLCLPPAGVSFKAVWPLPPPAYDLSRQDCAELYRKETAVDCLAEGVVALGEKIGDENNRLVFVVGDSGVPSVASEVFHQSEDDRHRIWVEIEEAATAIEIATTVLEAIRQRIGIAEPLLFRLDDACLNEPSAFPLLFHEQFQRLQRYSRRYFLVFINGRDCPGRELTHGSAKTVRQVLDWLKKEESVTTVLLGWDDGRWREELGDLSFEWVRLPPLLTKERSNTVTKLFKEVENISDSSEKARFVRSLAALSLFRKPCYLSATNAWPLVGLSPGSGNITPAPIMCSPTSGDDRSQDKDYRRSEYVRNVLLPILRKVGAIRDDNGQAVFMHRGVREEIRDYLTCNELKTQPDWMIEPHQGIADWYLKLYRASGDVTAAFEALYHRICCVGAAVEHDRPYMMRSGINEVYVTLRLMRPALRASEQPNTWYRRLAHHCLALAKLPDNLPGIRQAIGEAQHLLDLLKADLEELPPPASSTRPPKRPDLNAVEQFDDIRRLLHGRRYESATARIQEEFERIELREGWLTCDNPGSSTIRYDDCREQARIWVQDRNFDKIVLGTAVRVLRRHQALNILRAELFERLESSEQRKDALVRAEAAYIYATELMRNIDDTRFLQDENAFLRANQGLVLSWMHRPCEAHRRYNEAYGYLNQLETPPMSLRFATIDGRRTETFLVGVRMAAQDPSTKLRARGYLYDAIAAVERATYKSIDQHYPVWHGYLAELTMEVCCEIARQGRDAEELYARSRDRSGCGDWFSTCFESGYFVVGRDPIRLRRYVQLASTFKKSADATSMSRYIGTDCLSRIDDLTNKCLGRLAKISQLPAGGLDADVRRYACPK